MWTDLHVQKNLKKISSRSKNGGHWRHHLQFSYTDRWRCILSRCVCTWESLQTYVESITCPISDTCWCRILTDLNLEWLKSLMISSLTVQTEIALQKKQQLCLILGHMWKCSRLASPHQISKGSLGSFWTQFKRSATNQSVETWAVVPAGNITDLGRSWFFTKWLLWQLLHWTHPASDK